MTEAQAYVNGWNACMAGCDGRYMPESSSNGPLAPIHREAWIAGFNDAMEAEDDDEPCPEAAGYGEDTEATNPLNGETDPDGDAMGRMMGRNR